jgi:tripartite-type tricarboxylate transporter receptor subunit TctC
MSASGISILFGLALALAAPLVLAQAAAGSAAFPVKTVRIVTAEPGGGNDFVARLIAHGLTASWGQQVIVDNRGGAGGARAAQTVAQATPDGYTLLLYSSTLWIGPLLRGDAPFNPDKDFAPVTLADRAPNILVVNPAVQAQSVKELIALARAKPGALNYSSASSGGSTHLAGELFKAMAGVNIVRVFYKSGATEVLDLISGQVQMTFGTAATVTQHVKSGKLRALAVTSLQPSTLAPGLPTMAASGLPSYEAVALHAVFATAGTAAPVVRRLNEEIVRVLNQADIRDRMLNAGVEAVGNSPSELLAVLNADVARWGKVIKEAGIRAD